MGHERTGFLPKTERWAAIVRQLSDYDNSGSSAAKISDNTVHNLRSAYEKMPYDESVIKAIEYLATISVSANKQDQTTFLCNAGFIVDETISLFSLIKSAKIKIVTESGSLETNKIVQDSVAQTLASYEREYNNNQITFFGIPSIWHNVGSGAAFCDLARRFFAAFTERHLRYYLERELAHSINNYSSIEIFSQNLKDQVSRHAYETAKIMQSFAAGWYNKRAVDKVPSRQEITSFLDMAFGKMREEFRREADSI